MANVLVQEETLTNIADAIREKNGEVQQYKPTEMVDAIRNIPDLSGGDFWDIYQENGMRTNYQYTFSGKWWTRERFTPKYDIVPTRGSIGLFQDSNMPYDLDDILHENNITLDLSKDSYTFGCFMGAAFTKIGEVDLSSSSTVQQLFANSFNLTQIRKVKIGNISKATSMMLYNCPKLTSVTIDGTLYGDVGLQRSPLLSDESIQSVIDALADMTDNKQQTITLHSNVVAKLSKEQHLQIANKNWLVG